MFFLIDQGSRLKKTNKWSLRRHEIFPHLDKYQSLEWKMTCPGEGRSGWKQKKTKDSNSKKKLLQVTSWKRGRWTHQIRSSTKESPKMVKTNLSWLHKNLALPSNHGVSFWFSYDFLWFGMSFPMVYLTSTTLSTCRTTDFKASTLAPDQWIILVLVKGGR